MAAKLQVPTDSAGLQELLGDASKLKEFFSQASVTNGDTKAFLDAYAKQFVKGNPDSVDDLRTQVQSVMFDMIRDNGNGRRPNVDLRNAITFEGGKPTLRLDPNGTAAVARGRGTVYNKASRGAQFEQKFSEADRFGSIGEYCQAIKEERLPSNRRDRDELLRKLTNVREFQNSFSSEDPGSGGFLIPEIMRSELLSLALEQSTVRSRATVIPMSTLSVPIPTVDDTSHLSTVLGGIQFYWAEEASSITESTATFGKVTLTAKKLAGFFKVPNELLNDAPAFSAFFDTRVPNGLAWFEDNSFMNEDGVGAPQGFINCPASVQVPIQSGQATKTVLWENIVQMYSQMLPTSIPNAVWLCSIDTFPQLATMALSVGTGGGPVWIGGYGNSGGSSAPPMTILGRPVIFTEKVGPLGTTGDINFVDLSYYLIGDRQQMEVSASEHAFFQNDQTAYKIIERVDGRPWIQSALTPHNNSSSLLSPFVQLASR
jgi:HK97 family phage major capsid protein